MGDEDPGVLQRNPAQTGGTVAGGVGALVTALSTSGTHKWVAAIPMVVGSLPAAITFLQNSQGGLFGYVKRIFTGPGP